jgi:hypothetical protein
MKASLSSAQFIAYQDLLSAMYRATKEDRGVKVQVPLEQQALLKRAFYLCKSSEVELSKLSLLSTPDPSIFLIYHQPPERIPNGQDLE